MRKTLWIAGFVAIICGSALAADPRPATKAEIDYVKKGMSKRLKDPESARYTDVMVGPSEKGGLLVCGNVNAKNSYGGYVGSSRFVGMLLPENKDAFILGIDSADKSTADQMCAMNGM